MELAAVEQSQNWIARGIWLERADVEQALTSIFTTNTWLCIKPSFILNELFIVAIITEIFNGNVNKTNGIQKPNKRRETTGLHCGNSRSV